MVVRRLATIALCMAGMAAAQTVSEGELRDAISDIQKLAAGLHDGTKAYQSHLREAMRIYAADFGGDIRSGDPDQTERIKLRLFAAMINTAGVRLDPDPLRFWAEVQRLLDEYDSRIDSARGKFTRANLFDAKNRDNIPPAALKALRVEWRAAAKDAEREHDRAEEARTRSLKQGEMYVSRASEGRNLHVNLFGLELGREMGNVRALAQLTYTGQNRDGHVFLLTTLGAVSGKTRTDTTIAPRALLVHSNIGDPKQYGYVVTLHEYAAYRAPGERIAEAAPRTRDWIWKTLPDRAAPEPAVQDLEQAIERVRNGRRAVEEALDSFLKLASESTGQSDAALKAEAKTSHRKARLPEQELKGSFPELRARLYAFRAVLSGDPRFVASLDRVAQVQRENEALADQGRQLFSYFNGLSVSANPQVKWSTIDRLAADYMDQVSEARQSASRSVVSPLHPLPTVIVSQVHQGPERDNPSAHLVEEHILRDVHWTTKGIDRREYSSEMIQAWPDSGIHRVQYVMGPRFIQGPGGIAQVFEDLNRKKP